MSGKKFILSLMFFLSNIILITFYFDSRWLRLKVCHISNVYQRLFIYMNDNLHNGGLVSLFLDGPCFDCWNMIDRVQRVDF